MKLARANIILEHLPIIVYSICPHEAYLTPQGQREEKELMANGIGLITVESNGTVTKRFQGIPLSQFIGEAEFKQLVKSLPRSVFTALHESYNIYKTRPSSGMSEITELVEGMIHKSAKKSKANGWITFTSRDSVATQLDRMIASTEFQEQTAALGGARAFIKTYRTVAHHKPKNKSQAHAKYRKCKQGFYAAIETIQALHKAMKIKGIKII